MLTLRNMARTAQIVTVEGKHILFSYEVPIAIYDNKLLVLDKWDKFSYTTNKHLYQFIREYTPFTANKKEDIEKLYKEKNLIFVSSF